MRDVAKLAGVSPATVSSVLNRTRPVREEVRLRVEAAVERLRYRPDGLAKSLRRGRTRLLGLIVPDIANPFFAELGRSVENAAFARGYSLMLCNSDGQTAKEQAYLDLLLERRVDGVILSSVTGEPPGGKAARWWEVPTVMLDRVGAEAEVDTVRVDHQAGAQAITRHLVQLGHRRIGCLSGPSYMEPTRQRLAGYHLALREAGIEPEAGWIREGPFDYQSGYALAKEVLAMADLTALVAGNDLMAVGAMRAAADLGLKVPEDLSVAGFDDISLADMVSPRLSTLAQPLETLGRLAVELLLARRENPEGPYRHLLLPVTTQLRESTAPPTGVQRGVAHRQP